MHENAEYNTFQTRSLRALGSRPERDGSARQRISRTQHLVTPHPRHGSLNLVRSPYH